jgi:hypothetical protein
MTKSRLFLIAASVLAITLCTFRITMAVMNYRKVQELTAKRDELLKQNELRKQWADHLEQNPPPIPPPAVPPTFAPVEPSERFNVCVDEQCKLRQVSRI